MIKNKTVLSNIMLIIASAIWGSNFVFQKSVATDIGPFLFMSCRSFLGSMTMLLTILIMEKKKPNEERLSYTKCEFLSLFRLAIGCGIINVTGSVLVQFGLIYTTASKAGFLNAIYIIFVPILGVLFFKEKASKFTWIGVLLGFVGLYNLCLNETLTINPGDLIVLASTLFFALHIHLISNLVKKVNGIHLTCLEFLGASIYCLICSLLFEKPTFEQIIICLPSLLFAGVLGIGLCYMLQVTAQKYTNPTVAALLMSLEAVFGAIGGVLILNESFTLKEFIGILFIVSAIIVAQLSPREK